MSRLAIKTLATAMTTPWPKVQSACSKPRSSTSWCRGNPLSHMLCMCCRAVVGEVEWETLKWVNWYNTKRLHSKIGYITPQEAEEFFYEALNAAEKEA